MTDHPIDPYDVVPDEQPADETVADKPKRQPRPGSNPVGRPPLILDGWDPEEGTWDRQSPAGQVLTAIRKGAHRAAAFKKAGLSADTGYIWVARGREHMPSSEFDLTAIPREHLPYVQFLRAAERKDAEFEIELTDVVTKHALRNAPFALTVLARRYSHWRDKNRAVVPADGETPPGGQEGPTNADLLSLLREHPGVVEIADRLESLLTDDLD